MLSKKLGIPVVLAALPLRAILMTLAVALLMTGTAFAQVLTVLHSFNQNGTDGYEPLASVNQQAGKLYGTTYGGGSYGDYGTVFAMKKRSSGVWAESVLYSFAGGTDGANPYYSGVVFDATGNMYGTTQAGGTSGNGTVFKLTPSGSSWIESVLYSFTGGSDGGDPVSNVILDKIGNLYGTTGEGGDLACSAPYGCGTVFELSPQGDGTWTENVLYAFTGGDDGGIPVASLIFDKAGNLYGTTVYGGAFNAGTVFELTPSANGWTETVLYSFTGQTDGENPQAALIFDTVGNLYSTTEYGGTYGLGTVFELTPSGSGWSETVLHSFAGQGGLDGSHPLTAVVLDPLGNLYGSTLEGGGRGLGTVFRLKPSARGWTETVFTFTNQKQGSRPGGVTLGETGLYGTTQFGGAYDWGTVFEITP